MRRQFCRRLFAAAVGVLALAGSVSAQNQTAAPPLAPGVVVTVPPVETAAQPAPGPTVPSVPATVAAAPVEAVPAAGPAVVHGSGGCTNCGTGRHGFVMSGGGGYFGSDCPTGHRCNNGCGSLRSDCGFIFGSCRSFFAPCGPRGLGGHFQKTPVYGTGASGPFNPCIYDSYLNH